MPKLIRLALKVSDLGFGLLGLEIAAKEGYEVFTVSMAGALLHVVVDPALAEEIVKGDPHRFTKDFASINTGAKILFEVFGYNGLFLAATDDPAWGLAHRILKAPFSVKGIRNLVGPMNVQANRLVEALKRDVGYGGVTNIDMWVTKMAFETIAICGLGTSFGSFDAANDHPFIKALDDVMLGMKKVAFIPTWLRWLRPYEFAKLFAAAKVMRETCQEVIRKRRESQTECVGEYPDLLELMLHEKDPQTGQAMTEDMIVDNIMVFLLAGQDSTAAAMASCLCFLHGSPECEAKLRREIDDVVGTAEVVQVEHLSKLTYLDWCIKETLRLLPPSQMIMRAAKGDQLLGGRWHVPGGEQVVINVLALHYSTAFWGEDAAKFRPERWEAGPPHPFAYLPFASGPRKCIGREFTTVEQKITMVKLFQNFSLRRPDDGADCGPEYITVRRKDMPPPFDVGMDVDMKKASGFVGVCSRFQLLERAV